MSDKFLLFTERIVTKLNKRNTQTNKIAQNNTAAAIQSPPPVTEQNQMQPAAQTPNPPAPVVNPAVSNPVVNTGAVNSSVVQTPPTVNNVPPVESQTESVSPNVPVAANEPGGIAAQPNQNAADNVTQPVEVNQAEATIGAITQEDDSAKEETKQPLPKVHPHAEWKMLEPPSEMGDRVSHFFIDNRSGPRDWVIVGASRRGRMHENDGTFREDAFQIEVEKESGWLLIAVADGAGSHHLSRVGSNLAVKTAVEVMVKKVLKEKDTPCNPVAKDALQEALKKAWEALYMEAERRAADKTTFRDLSTTLLLLMYHPRKNLVGVAQIGDGLLAAQMEDDRIMLLGKPESGEYSGQTYFLTNHKPEELASKVDVLETPGQFKMFFIMSDGVSDDFYPHEDPQKGLPLLARYLPQVIKTPDLDSASTALLELINYSKQASFDDRTLVLAYRPDLFPDEIPAGKVAKEEPKESVAPTAIVGEKTEASDQPEPVNTDKNNPSEEAPKVEEA